MADTDPLTKYRWWKEESDRDRIKPIVKEKVIKPQKIFYLKPQRHVKNAEEFFSVDNSGEFMGNVSPFDKKLKKHNFLRLRSDFYGR